jgi:hypothetical protein
LLLLILFGFLTLEQPREAAGNGKLKDHQKLGARTARDYSTTFGAGCKGCSHISLLILLSHEAEEWKKIRRGWKEL